MPNKIREKKLTQTERHTGTHMMQPPWIVMIFILHSHYTEGLSDVWGSSLCRRSLQPIEPLPTPGSVPVRVLALVVRVVDPQMKGSWFDPQCL